MKIIVRWRPLALVGLALFALLLRLYNLNWDQGNSFHPDERQIMFHVTALAWPKNLAQFFEPANSPLNPHFFAYGSFPLYLLALLGGILAHYFPLIGTFVNLTLVGRVLSALFDSGTVLLTGWLGLYLAEDVTAERRHAWNLAFLAAAFVTFTPLELQLSHFYAVDTLLLFFVTLTVLACVALVETKAPIRWSLVAGLGYGLALATKFSAAPLIVPLLVAVSLRWFKQRDLFSAALAFLLTLCTTVLVFLIAMPYALLDLENFKQQVMEQGDLARGLLDYPYVRQFAGTIPYVYEAQNILLWGMGVTLGLAAFAGLLWLLWRVWKRQVALPWLIILSWVVTYGAITGNFYVKFMRYMLPIYPFLALVAAAVLLAFARRERAHGWGYRRQLLRLLPALCIVLVLAGTIFQGLALLNVYSQPNTRVQASRWIFSHIKAGSVLTFEQWDDPLPVAVDGYNPEIYQQAVYTDANNQLQMGLDLYGDDTTDKARLLAKLLPTIDVLTMATDRLDKSIPRLPARYPLTIHYYNLLFSGQLGFHLAAQFEDHPTLFGLTLDDSNADESYSVFDHPHVRLFVRDNPYPYTPDQLFQKLLDGVQLPPLGAQLSGAQHSLLLTPQQIADDQQSPPFSVQFPADSLSNAAPVFFWWLALTLLGMLVYPLVFPAFRVLRDRGYIFSKTLGILLLAYAAWLLASLRLVAFSHLSLILVLLVLFLISAGILVWRRRTILAFLRAHWRLLVLEEGIFTLAYLAFVGIRALNPDLWNPYFGGEKPMELAFLNAILRSPYMPPLDPWFSGGYINYYYYGYVLVGVLTKLTGIVPTTAFNLAIPTLFALTFSGVVSLLYSLTRYLPMALLGGYFATIIANFDGLIQLKAQILALIAHAPPPLFSYWQSSRIIPNTINEFPFWSFLFADLHPHVIDLPIAVLMLGILAAFVLSAQGETLPPAEQRRETIMLYGLAAFVFGTIACVNTWDVPVYALLLAVVLLLQVFFERRGRSKLELLVSLGFRLVVVGLLCGIGYLLYWPFYSSYQQLYVNGLGLVPQGTQTGTFLMVFGFWIFLALSYFLVELYHRWRSTSLPVRSDRWSAAGYIVLCGVVLIGVTLLGLKMLLGTLLVLGIFLFITWYRTRLQGAFLPPGKDRAYPDVSPASIQQDGASLIDVGASIVLSPAARQFLYLMLLIGLGITLGQEIVYVRDFLDGGDYERMNTVFKFSMSAWLCFAIGGALAVQRMWVLMRGSIRHIWSVCLIILLVCGSIFLSEGTASRIQDHQNWALTQPPLGNTNYIPTVDGYAFVQAWFPGDANAISWLNAHVAGSPVILEAAAPVSYQWFNRVSVYTGFPDVLGWPDHVSEQRYNYQPLNRVTDIEIIYTTLDPAEAFELLRYYHVRYIYVGALEQQLYPSAGLQKFDRMVGTSLKLVYRSQGVTIYEVW